MSQAYRFTPVFNAPVTLYWTTKAQAELSVLLPLAPLNVRDEVPAKIESFAKRQGRESVSGETVMLFFKEAF